VVEAHSTGKLDIPPLAGSSIRIPHTLPLVDLWLNLVPEQADNAEGNTGWVN